MSSLILNYSAGTVLTCLPSKGILINNIKLKLMPINFLVPPYPINITYITVLNCVLSKFIPIDTYSLPHESKFPAFSIFWFFKKFILCEIHTCGTVLMCQITQKSTLTPTQAKKCIRGNRVFGNRVMQRLGLDMLKLFKLDTRWDCRKTHLCGLLGRSTKYMALLYVSNKMS